MLQVQQVHLFLLCLVYFVSADDITDEIWHLPALFQSLFYETAKCCSLSSRLWNGGGKIFLLILLHILIVGFQKKWRSCISTTTNSVTDWFGFRKKANEAKGEWVDSRNFSHRI